MTKKFKKLNFSKIKKYFQINDIDVNKILVSKKQPYGKHNSLIYFIGYNDNDVIRPLCLRLPQITGYVKKFNENAIMPFRVNNNKQLLKNYNKIWEKIEKLMRIDFESKPVYGDGDKYIETNIKIYKNSLFTNFHNKKMPKEKSPCKCLSIITLDSVTRANKKHIHKHSNTNICKIKNENYINEDLESDSDSNDETESDIDNDRYDK